ncbi:adomet-dependent RRNA methyltransferase spb1 [Phtheirospermum japonicum]|uniref:Adomet-dependent RRNA methyltransferase spb1 n=1 Tax=Phtheirospermum japonicum TaxID=374723 RepID=A0A830BK94_9LAMI|nr:adomet-dependent RRNA methyltransferase spb1 [Phtheirospermum japonicum]
MKGPAVVVFRSQDYTAVLFCLIQLFEKVEVDKPLASRSASAEIYLLGLKYKAPANIDPRLLDVRGWRHNIEEIVLCG